MPQRKISAVIEMGGGTSTTTITLDDDREHCTTRAIDPACPEGAPEEFVALDELRKSISNLEASSYAELYDLMQTKESADRAKALGLHQSEPQTTSRERRPVEPTTAYRRAEYVDGGRPQYIDTGVRPVHLQHDPFAAALDGACRVVDVVPPGGVRGGRRPEPAPYVARGNRQGGRLVVTTDGAYRIVPYRVVKNIDLSRTPSRPSDEWLRDHLAYEMARQLQDAMEFSSAERCPGGVLQVSAELLVLRREGADHESRNPVPWQAA